MSELVKNLITDAIIIAIISNSLNDNTYKMCFYGIVSIYLIKKYI